MVLWRERQHSVSQYSLASKQLAISLSQYKAVSGVMLRGTAQIGAQQAVEHDC